MSDILTVLIIISILNMPTLKFLIELICFKIIMFSLTN